MLVDVILQSLCLAGGEVAVVAGVAQPLVGGLLVPPEVTGEVVASVAQVALVLHPLVHRLLVQLQVRRGLGPVEYNRNKLNLNHFLLVAFVPFIATKKLTEPY